MSACIYIYIYTYICVQMYPQMYVNNDERFKHKLQEPCTYIHINTCTLLWMHCSAVTISEKQNANLCLFEETSAKKFNIVRMHTSVFQYRCMCVSVCIYICIYINTFIYICIHTHTRARTHVYIYLYIYRCIHIYMYIYAYIHIHIYVKTYIYIHTCLW